MSFAVYLRICVAFHIQVAVIHNISTSQHVLFYAYYFPVYLKLFNKVLSPCDKINQVKYVAISFCGERNIFNCFLCWFLFSFVEFSFSFGYLNLFQSSCVFLYVIWNLKVSFQALCRRYSLVKIHSLLIVDMMSTYDPVSHSLYLSSVFALPLLHSSFYIFLIMRVFFLFIIIFYFKLLLSSFHFHL